MDRDPSSQIRGDGRIVGRLRLTAQAVFGQIATPLLCKSHCKAVVFTMTKGVTGRWTHRGTPTVIMGEAPTTGWTVLVSDEADGRGIAFVLDLRVTPLMTIVSLKEVDGPATPIGLAWMVALARARCRGLSRDPSDNIAGAI